MNDVSPGKLTLMIGALVTLAFSFLPWFSISVFGTSVSRSAWSSGMLPMATLAPILAFLAGGAVAVETFKLFALPEKIWEFTVDQMVIIFSAFTFLITLCYLVMDKGGADVGVGLILSFIGSAAMIAGYFMDRAGVGVNPNANAGGQNFGFPPPGQPNQPPAGQAPPFQQPPTQAPPAQAPPTQPPPMPQPQPEPPTQAPPTPPTEPPDQSGDGTF